MRKTVILGLSMMMFVAACSGGDSADFRRASDELAAVGAEPEVTMAPTDSDDGAFEPAEGETVSMSSPEGRKVIHRASISIEAEDTRAVYATIQEMVEVAGGFIQAASVNDPHTGEDQPRIDMVLRIPADDLNTTLEDIAALGTRLISQSQHGDDVTEEYVDIEARISNLSLLETELRALLEDVRQQPEADPAKLLQVFNEISRVRGEIEQLEGRRQVLDDLTALATVEVQVSPTPDATPVVAEGWAPVAVARQALQDLVAAFQGIGDFAIRFGLYVAPLALIFLGLPALGVWRLRRRFGLRRVTEPAGGETA